MSETTIIIIGIIGAVIVAGSLWLLLGKKKETAEEPVVFQEIDPLAEANPKAELSIENEYIATTVTEEAPVDLFKIESIDSDKPFANLKSNSIGTTSQEPTLEPAKPSKKTSTIKTKKATGERKNMKASSGTSGEQLKKRTYRKKDTQV